MIADDTQAFAAALIRCLTDDEHRSQLGAAGREVVRRRYTLEGIGDRFDEALRETIGDDAKGGQG